MQYLYVHFNESFNSHKHEWQLLSQNRQTRSKLQYLLHYMLEMSTSSEYQDLTH